MSQALFKDETPNIDSDTRDELITRFLAFMEDESVLRKDEDLFPYESDGLAVYRQKPPLVVLPETIEQVQKILKICHELQVPVVARGAGTGLSGGALPLKNGIVLGMAKFNKILDINEKARTAVVQPGVRNLHDSTQRSTGHSSHHGR